MADAAARLSDGEPSGGGEALVLAAHGSHADPRAERPVLDHADRLRDRGPFDEVRTAFWKGEPSLRSVLRTVGSDAVTVVPLLTSEGYFARQVFPRELRLDGRALDVDATVRYADPVGTHPAVTDVVRQRAASTGAPDGAALAVVGHGTDRSPTSGASARTHAERVRERGRFPEVGALFLDESPGVGGLPDRFDADDVVVVPLFVADAGHAAGDVPAALGLDGVPADGPAAVGGRRLWFAGAVGTAPALAAVVVARTVEVGADLPGVDRSAGTVADLPGWRAGDGSGDGPDVPSRTDGDPAETTTGNHPRAAGPRTAAGRAFCRWVECAGGRATGEDGGRSGERGAGGQPTGDPAGSGRPDGRRSRRWGQLLVTATGAGGDRRYEVRHRADRLVARSSLDRFDRPRDLRDLARFDADGRYRPLRSARSLPRGWVLPGLDAREVVRAVEHVYPASVADWHRERTDRLDVTHFRAAAARQSGRYESLEDVPTPVLSGAVEACCGDCVRRRTWEERAGEPVPAGGDEGTIPCREPCPVFLAAAREFARLEDGRDPDGELGRAGERYRTRYLRARGGRDRSGIRDDREGRDGREGRDNRESGDDRNGPGDRESSDGHDDRGGCHDRNGPGDRGNRAGGRP